MGQETWAQMKNLIILIAHNKFREIWQEIEALGKNQSCRCDKGL